jgi:hypothetical protein
MNNTFVDRCLAGEALLDEIDDYVDIWHSSDAAIPLHEFLGLSWDEYSAWVGNPRVLPFIISSKRSGRPFSSVAREESLAMAARAENAEQARKLIQWLQDAKII